MERKKNKILLATLQVIISICIISGPYTLFRVCAIMDKVMKCRYSCRMESLFGIIILLCGVFIFISKTKEARNISRIVALICNIFGILTIKYLIGGCDSMQMNCQQITFPCLLLLHIVCFGVVILNFVLDNREKE